jgi:hypothetical protein
MMDDQLPETIPGQAEATKVNQMGRTIESKDIGLNLVRAHGWRIFPFLYRIVHLRGTARCCHS